MSFDTDSFTQMLFRVKHLYDNNMIIFCDNSYFSFENYPITQKGIDKWVKDNYLTMCESGKFNMNVNEEMPYKNDIYKLYMLDILTKNLMAHGVKCITENIKDKYINKKKYEKIEIVKL